MRDTLFSLFGVVGGLLFLGVACPGAQSAAARC